MELSDLSSYIIQWAKIIFPVIAGLWVFYKYFREGFHRPRIEFDIECNVIGSNPHDYLVEFVLLAKNKGNIKFTFPELILRIRGIEENKEFSYWQNSI
jgi:hypothetical protein